MIKEKSKLKNTTLLTLYFNEDEAIKIVDKLNEMHSRYYFHYKKENRGNVVYLVYCSHSRETNREAINELLTYLLDRIVYGLA